jgi:ATP-dependent Clp protease ATP-binding subunit ClpA
MNAFIYSRDSIESLIKDFERLFSEIKQNRDKIILFLDEMQMQSIVAFNKENQYNQIQNFLKSCISKGELNIIAATTPENYYKFIKSDEVLSLSFSPILVNEPDEKEMLEILYGVKPYFEKHYSLKIPENLFEKIYSLSKNFVPHRAFPHKAIDLLDISCSKAFLKKEMELSPKYFYQSISTISKLPYEVVKRDPQEYCRGILDYLKKNVVNQKNALEEVARIIKLSRLSRLEDNIINTKPEGIFLFLGPTGVGKSYVASKIATYLFGINSKLRVINFIDYKNPEDINKLISDDKLNPGILIQEIENHPFSVVLFENIENVHSSILYFLGKVLSKGEIIDTFGKRHYLSNIIFILSLTSIGEKREESHIGFVKGNRISNEIIVPLKIMNMLDWVDEIIEFSPLTENHLRLIVSQRIDKLKYEMNKKYSAAIDINKNVIDMISYKALQSGSYAHSVVDIIGRELKTRILDYITKNNKKIKLEVGVISQEIKIKVK